jgi:RNA-binding protein 8A
MMKFCRLSVRLNSSHRNSTILAVGGWVIFVSGLSPECREPDIYSRFSDFGSVTHVRLEINRLTGAAMGYALVEYATREEGELAVSKGNKTLMLGSETQVSWCFVGSSRSDTRPAKRLSG